MKHRSSFYSAWVDKEIPQKFQDEMRYRLEKDDDFKAFQENYRQLCETITKDPEPDFEARKDEVFLKLKKKIEQGGVKIKPILFFNRNIRATWAAAAVFVALLGGWLLGRTTTDTQIASVQTNEEIVFSLPDDFDLVPAGDPQMIRLSSYGSEP